MQKKSKFPYIIGTILIIAISALSIYIYWQKKFPEFPLKRFLINLSIISASAIILGFILYALINREKKNDKNYESPKDPVDIVDAIKIWKTEFIIDNEIPFRVVNFKTKEIMPIEENDLQYGDIISYTDPSNQTSDRFVSFEVTIANGKRTGMLVATIPIDLGKEYIKKNWLQNTRWNKSMNTHNPQIKRYPLTSSKSYYERMMMKRVELIDEGYSEKELGQTIDPFLTMQQSHDKQETEKRKKEAPIRSSNISEVYDVGDTEEEPLDADDLKEDIDSFRRANR